MVMSLRLVGIGAQSVVALSLLLAGASSVAADTCEAIGELQSEVELRRFVESCPTHSAALNNLAVLLENAGRLDEAKTYYERAIESDPAAVAPYAGLGDILRKQLDPAGAVRSYGEFLSRLQALRATGRSQPMLAHEAEYRCRQAELPTASQRATDILRADSITRSLTTKPVRMRGLSLQGRTGPHIDVHIRFDFDSARLRPETGPQFDEIAKALKNAALSDRHIVIEGHTDSTGPEGYNRNLSICRSAAVRLELMARGIEGHRLSALGFGESRPIADNATEEGQSRNRRVTFVNMGKR